MTNPASASDLEGRFFRPLTEHELEIAPLLLDDAYDLLVGRRPTLEADIASNIVREATVIRVLCAMVGRIFSNPEGKLEEQIDDYRYRRDSVVSSGALYVSPDELSDITPGRKSRRSVRMVAYGQYEPYS